MAPVHNFLVTRVDHPCQHFFNTCKILGKRTTSTNNFHSQSNGSIEIWHRLLHCGLSNYIISENNNWDKLVTFYLLSYRSTPNSVIGHSPIFLLHGTEMEISNNNNLEARICREKQSQKTNLEDSKAVLHLA